MSKTVQKECGMVRHMEADEGIAKKPIWTTLAAKYIKALLTT